MRTTRTKTLGLSLRRWLTPALAAGLALPVVLASPAAAADGTIDYVESEGGTISVLYSLPAGSPAPDLDSVQVSLEGAELDATAELAADSGDTVRRTTVIAMDVSDSMARNNRFTEAKAAAQVYLDSVPDDVFVGLVTFAGEVTEAQAPTQDREALSAVIDGLELSRGTLLYPGVRAAVEASGTEGARTVLVLSDGRDTSGEEIGLTTEAIEAAEVNVDVVALEQTEADIALVQPLSNAGNGLILDAENAEALGEVFASQAEGLAQQILITAPAPADAAEEGTINVSVEAGGEPYTASAFVTVSSGPAAPAGDDPFDLKTVEASGPAISESMMLVGLGVAGVAVAFLLVVAFGGVGGNRKDAVAESIEAYTRKGARKLAAKKQQQEAGGVTASAVAVAEKALQGNKGLESSLGAKLESAGMQIKPAEWVLAHAGIAMVLATAGFLLGSGSLLYLVLGLLFGLAGPYLYLGFKRSRRLKAFKAQLADTLQLMAGSLSAGLSLAQSVDTVVKEGQDPMANEFRRALVESRLGVDIEEALAGVAERMQSKDFEWVVMAIRIQREVGGNLSELLGTVAETIREREYLERQVSALSAEGRLSVWVLGGLPPGFLLYLLVANPTYLEPMYTTVLGYLMLGAMSFLLVVGVFWMKKLVKVEV